MTWPADQPVPAGPPDQPGCLGAPADLPVPAEPADLPVPAEPADLPVPAEPADLPVPAEPAELRARTRALAEQAPEQARALLDAGSWIADPLWRHWGPALAAAGMDRQGFGAVVAGYRRELWLWVMGERTWAQSADGLRGRVRRRVAAPGRRAAAAR